MGDNTNYDEIKEVLSTKEALGIICFDKHHHHVKVSCAKISELLKVPVNKVKETCEKLEAMKILKMYKTGYDVEVEIVEHENDKVKQMIDEVIWEQKQEYGVIYKKLITAELLDFMGDV